MPLGVGAPWHTVRAATRDIRAAGVYRWKAPKSQFHFAPIVESAPLGATRENRGRYCDLAEGYDSGLRSEPSSAAVTTREHIREDDHCPDLVTR